MTNLIYQIKYHAFDSWHELPKEEWDTYGDHGKRVLCVVSPDAQGEHVRFDQAVELLAAKDETLRKFGNVQKAYEKHIETIKADNAAKDTWVKEYETGLVDFHREMSALEAKLAAAEKELQIERDRNASWKRECADLRERLATANERLAKCSKPY